MFTLTIKDQNGQIADSFSFDHGSYVVGRLDKCDVVLPSSSVSREHARIFIEDDRCYVEDLNSANGVIVDGQRVVKKRDLGTASQMRVGEYYLYLEYERPRDTKQDVMSTLFIDSGSEHHKLVRVNDSFAGEEFILSEQENTIGRTDDNFILLSDSSISRKHAVIHRRGEAYFIEDQGSSNGTRLNGQDVDGRQELSTQDIVEFGNVEFVFAEGDASVNPEQQSPAGSDKGLSNYASIAVFLVLGLAIGGAVVFGFVLFLQEPDDGEDPLEAEVQELLSSSESQLQAGNLDSAHSSVQNALDMMPGHDEAERMQERVERERQGAEQLQEGRRLSEEGRHSEARDLLLDIPEDTRAYRRAQQTLQYVNGTLTHNLQSEARRLLRSDDEDALRRAHEKVAEAQTIAPDDDNIARLAEQIEEELAEADIDLE